MEAAGVVDDDKPVVELRRAAHFDGTGTMLLLEPGNLMNEVGGKLIAQDFDVKGSLTSSKNRQN